METIAFEKLVAQAHKNITRYKPEYAPTTTEISDEIEKIQKMIPGCKVVVSCKDGEFDGVISNGHIYGFYWDKWNCYYVEYNNTAEYVPYKNLTIKENVTEKTKE